MELAKCRIVSSYKEGKTYEHEENTFKKRNPPSMKG